MDGMSRRAFVAGVASAVLSACAMRENAEVPEPATDVNAQEDGESTETEGEDEMVEAATEQVEDQPLELDSSGFVLLADAVPDAIQEIRYYTTYNFVGARIDGYEQPVALITREAGEALRRASDLLVAQGYRIKVFDAYRPQRAVDHFARWALDPSDARMQPYFYPDLDKSVLFELGYINSRSGHTRGSTVDLTLFDMASGCEVDMGGVFDFFGERSHPGFAGVTEQQYAARMLLQSTMIEAGFSTIPTEWWHFTLANEPYPDTYFDFPVSTVALR